MTCQDILRGLPPSPPSVQTVLCALYERHPLTGSQLRDATGLPRRTVYAALERLRGFGILEERVSLRDSRQTYFWLDLAHLPAGTEQLAAAA
ncbi:MAG TPA: helix-turn-helix transcriptional regulator [Candidatus Thermoplasmatota archaeon]|nr:helix-turn-helix transcriptional regulator [Candidatus Thermoplasmatota archaeon]